MSDAADRREWFTAAELAALDLPHVPTSERGVQHMARRDGWDVPEARDRTWRPRQGRGGGVEYHVSALPQPAQVAFHLRFAPAAAAPRQGRVELQRGDAWATFNALSDKKKAEAKRRLDLLLAVEAAQRTGVKKCTAVHMACRRADIAPSGFYRWEALVRGLDRADWLPALAPRHAGAAGPLADCTPEAWDWLRATYLRPEQPNFLDCYRQLQRVAREQGWTIPSARTLERRMAALPETTRVVLRSGAEALKRLMPAQSRDHGVFHALQAVNLDDHRMDVFVRWEDGTVARPHIEAVQDIYSGMILGWRVDRSENTQAIRLAIGDVVEEWGIPEIFWFDNTRAAANKQITGGAKTRFRFKVKEEDPAGLIEMLGAEVRFTRPYHGQAKPVERAFRDAATEWAKDMRFAGFYTGNSPTAKPANYNGGKAGVPIEQFRAVIAERVEEHNTRIGRQSRVCAGRSFRQAFDESYAAAAERGLIRKAAPAQRLLFLLQAEPLTIRTEQPALHLHGNRYFADWMLQMPGQKVVARFDADALHDDIHCYRLDGSYIGPAECLHAVGFADTAAARDHARKTKALLRAHRDLAELERGMSLRQAAALLPKIEKAASPPETKVVRPLFGTVGNAALKPRADELPDDLPETTRNVVTALNAFFPAPKRPADE